VAITGGARGIGRATATEFATAGAKVAIGDLDVELAEKAAIDIGNATGAQVVGLPLDVTQQPRSNNSSTTPRRCGLSPLPSS
jgi:NAD(P)-dependent dehydrogenase (short-subunit alcohol dehydrogenase family)